MLRMSAVPEISPYPEAYDDLYRRLRRRVLDWAAGKNGVRHTYMEFVLAAPDMLHLLYRLMLDPRVNGADKAKLAGAFAYFVMPVDLIAEAFVGPIGFLDDMALAALVVSQIVSRNPEAVVRNWAGDQNVIALIEKILARAEAMLGYRVWKLIKRRVRSDA
jgi:uncharacterized membrane protein YkvA (DUF1232 family)